MCWKKDVRRNCGRVLACDRVSQRWSNSCSHTCIDTHTHTLTDAHIYIYGEDPLSGSETACLPTGTRLFHLCVWDCLCFSWPWSSQPHSESLSRALGGRGGGGSGLAVWTLQLSVAALDCLSMFVFVWALDDGALSTCCIYQLTIDVFAGCTQQLSAGGRTVTVASVHRHQGSFVWSLVSLRRCLLIRSRLNQQIGMTLNACVCGLVRGVLFSGYLHAKRF